MRRSRPLLLSVVLLGFLAGRDASSAPPPRAHLKPLPENPAKPGMLSEAWREWQSAEERNDATGGAAALTRLEKLREDLGLQGLEVWSEALVKAARARLRGDKPGGADAAIRLGETAVHLSPSLPHARYALARIYLQADPAHPDRALRELWTGLQGLPRDPRDFRATVGDLTAAALVAFVAVTVAVAFLLFIRRAGLLFHDVHHLFPRVLSGWLTAIIVLALVGLPILMRAGLVPSLLAAAAAVVLYLGRAERWVLLSLLALLGAVPSAVRVWAEAMDFAGTAADDAFQIERGGPGAVRALERLAARASRNEASAAELWVLGRSELRAGAYDKALTHFKEVALVRSNDARVLTAMGNALFARGDPDGALALYRAATEADPGLASAFHNLGRLYEKRAEALDDSVNAPVKVNAQEALVAAERLDPALKLRSAPDAGAHANRLLVLPPLSDEDWRELGADEGGADRAARAETQASLAVLGDLRGQSVAYYPLAAAVGLWALTLVLSGLKPSRPCQKCGRAACRRCAPTLPLGATQCGACQAIFSARGGLSAPERVRKQIELAHRQSRSERGVTTAGILFAGFGHLVSGRPVRGLLWSFLAASLVTLLLFRNGVLRTGWEPYPRALVLGLAAAAWVGIYAISLRDLFKRRG